MIEIFNIGFLSVTFMDVIDLALVSWLFYKVYLYFHGTRAGQMLVGLIILLIISFLFNAFGLSASSWLVNQFQTVWVVAFVILFQPELRRLLIYVGQTRFFQKIFRVGSSRTIESLVEASQSLMKKGWGALIVVQRETGLRTYKEAGTPLKAEVSAPLLVSIFNPTSPLHDGAIILQNNIIEAASCILPLTESKMIDPEMGTRHRAALGLSEETDAIVIVVSEEKKNVTVAEEGRFVKLNMNEMDFRKYLNERLFISSGD
ncbi:MAG: TIGR00159 family protein [Candidatus Marinimicrobia bacterium]|jgi:diadenylate cyclase|nr:TIGR00159 family protein [Candidatus Neomarinimicrobiota bacterium]MBT3618437.1 TIGR00159 family protein [Candidatus Neomarinimicrobiota bacterium]MBT3829007.1 TIGR00159 family protein [Candidatus Neomarinimicrobiota bacterium]MBT3997950.1 TIGR00159 family protein [Candidatus Neomarinimicrobiota bacterium]MBT4280032.1 TIGR00159 family protein [Candidatus Neomarinimicrobiota bacterium]